ncbi:hypothetical protein HPB50_013511 [Hyalomma asiaticum]|uniref:Uncharacterized protein n=1 Tax=Hyalomma asiaticum TaxID=266040 RepID=A0ACB7RM19_HYAAI|nr:hypothetical protein HPB50_013511 [Hyalomma asiaticum]
MCAMFLPSGHTQTPSSTPTSPRGGDRVTRLRCKRSGKKHVSSNRSLVLKLGVCFLYLVALQNVVSTVFKCTYTRIPMNVLDAVSVACRTFFAALTSHLYCRAYPDVARFMSRDRKLDPG